MKNILAIRQFVKRNQILKDEGYSSYQDFLKSPAWKKAKERIDHKITKGKTWYSVCWCCGSSKDLELHHLKYNTLNLTGKVGNYLKYVCASCHEIIHHMTSVTKVSIKTATKELRQRNYKLGAPVPLVGGKHL